MDADDRHAAASSCASCGTELSTTAKFCSECGAPVAPAGPSAEYKQVTVLFADVVHSMDIATSVGPERLREIIGELVVRSSTVIRRYGGTLDKFTGDGIMAVFGAPIALEDHAVRACRAALSIQQETGHLAADVDRRDGIALQVRVGLNSGEVVAGEFESTPLGYTAIGEQVGMAQRMESVAPPGGVMLSASTARLVESAAVLAEQELVPIKGADKPVPARRLVGMAERHSHRSDSNLIGRQLELSTIERLLSAAINGHGAVVGVVGQPGIGKSRLLREIAAVASRHNVRTYTAYCESHTSQVPFHAVAGVLRAANGIEGLDAQAARDRLRTQFPHAADEDLQLFDDLLGVADHAVVLPRIDPDARRRRLTAFLHTASSTRGERVIYAVEDVHWIDEVSESMLAEFFAIIAQTPALVLITYRPEYQGALSRIPGAHTVAVAPLDDSETASLVAELLGAQLAASALARIIEAKAAGNPFFAEELVRELADRGVLGGEPGAYTSTTPTTEVTVPATLQATVAARIDRLAPQAKRTLSAAAVIGSRFDPSLIAALGVQPALAELTAAQFIDEVPAGRQSEFAFHHPLIRAVAYQSQLRSDRATLHRRLAAALEAADPAAPDEKCALIAEHLEAAGDLHAAFGWHMRAAAWAINRDINAARLSWERAQAIADSLPDEDPYRPSMRISPRAMLCSIAWRVQLSVAGTRFEELRRLCDAAGDKGALAIAMTGLLIDLAYHNRTREASLLASEHMALIDSLAEPGMTVLLSSAPIQAKVAAGEWSDVLQWSQRVIDQSDPSQYSVILDAPIGSPWSLAYASRGLAKLCLGLPDWHDDLTKSVAMARRADALSYTMVVTYVYGVGVPLGALAPNDSVVREIEAALARADHAGDDLALAYSRQTLGTALVHRATPAERDRGHALLTEAKDIFTRRYVNLTEMPIINVYIARERARHGERDDALALIRAAISDLVHEGRLLGWGVQATGVLVEVLVDGGSERDVAEADAAVARLTATFDANPVPGQSICLPWLRALLARARDDELGYRHHRDRYRALAAELGFEGHADRATSMP